MNLDAEIIHRETNRQRIVVEARTERIKWCAAASVLVVVAGIAGGLMWKTIDTPDPATIAAGTRIDCVVEGSP